MSDRMTELHNQKWDNLRNIGDETLELASLARAFYRTGNHTVAEELSTIANNINDATKLIRDAMALESSENLKNSEALSGAMVSGMLAMAMKHRS